MIKLVYEHMPSVLIGTLQKDDETGDMTLYVNLGQKELIPGCLSLSGYSTGSIKNFTFYERDDEGIKKVKSGFKNIIQNITQIGENNTIQNISQIVHEPNNEEEKEEEQGFYSEDD